MGAPEIIAERRLEIESPGRPRRGARIALAKPMARGDGAFGCLVLIEGFGEKDRPFEVVGVDSLQALSLAFTYLRASLNLFQKRGGGVYFPGDNNALDPDQIGL